MKHEFQYSIKLPLFDDRRNWEVGETKNIVSRKTHNTLYFICSPWSSVNLQWTSSQLSKYYVAVATL